MLTFSERVKLSELYDKWLDFVWNDKAIRLEDSPATFLVFLQSKELLDEDNIKNFLKNA